MISSIFVVLVCFFMVLINHSVNGSIHTPKFRVTSKPFKFGYEEGSYLNMDLRFKLPPNVTGYVVFFNDRDISLGEGAKGPFEIRRSGDETGEFVANVRGNMTGEHVYIDVHLYNETGMILNKRISQGVTVKSVLNSNRLDSTYSLICFNATKCEVEADLRKETLGYKGLLFSRSLTAGSLDPVPDTDADIKKTKSGNGYMTINIIICLSVFAIAILVVTIASFTRSWWFNRDTPKLFSEPQQKFVPFYANLLFRKECQEIIDDLEQNHYELIDPFERR